MIYSEVHGMLKIKLEGGNDPIILDPPCKSLSRLIRECQCFDLNFWHYFLLYRGFKLIRVHKTFLIYTGNAPGIEIWADLCGHYDTTAFNHPYFRKIYRSFKSHENGKKPPAKEGDWGLFSCWVTGLRIQCKQAMYRTPIRGWDVREQWDDFLRFLRILKNDPKFLPLYLHDTRFGTVIKEALSFSESVNETP